MFDAFNGDFIGVEMARTLVLLYKPYEQTLHLDAYFWQINLNWMHLGPACAANKDGLGLGDQ